MYPTIDSIVDAVISLGQGCLLYNCDVKKAIVSFLWTPRIIIYWLNQFYFNTVLTMGLHFVAVSTPYLSCSVLGFPDNKGALCSIISMILSEFLPQC